MQGNAHCISLVEMVREEVWHKLTQVGTRTCLECFFPLASMRFFMLASAVREPHTSRARTARGKCLRARRFVPGSNLELGRSRARWEHARSSRAGVQAERKADAKRSENLGRA